MIWQLWCYHDAYTNLKREISRWPGSGHKSGGPHSRPRCGLLNDLHSTTDIAGLFGLAALLRSLQAAEDVIPVNRGRGFVSRIFPETIGAAWFTVSLLSTLAITDFDTGSNFDAMFKSQRKLAGLSATLSIVGSFLTVVKGLYGIPSLLRWHLAN